MGLQKTLNALADPTRRAILELLKGGRKPAGEIAERFDISFAAVSRHLSVLRGADLIRDRGKREQIARNARELVLEKHMISQEQCGKIK